MSAHLLNAAAHGICSHGGEARPQATSPRVKLSGLPALPQNPGWPVVRCIVPPVFGAGPTGQLHTIMGQLPCFLALWQTATVRVKSVGQPLLLDNSHGIGMPSGLPVTLVPSQIRVKAI